MRLMSSSTIVGPVAVKIFTALVMTPPIETLTRLAGWFVSDVINFRLEHVIMTSLNVDAGLVCE